ncbi:hypothetical protein [Alkalibacillus salilacus]|uniref:DUF2268 domain-containing protein n=1 Tax=Alkalibacillus salilacus TaxID=284582 RepID=A0ABT9VEX1_9BACI|nr:hypothetical protein [Alkalibacillus salilacus]MDQ0159503.1 hypothetical protein [Alkalibacillus salilacus]
MEFINFAYSQINCNEQNFIHHPFFREYLKVFNSNDDFHKNVNELTKNYSTNDINGSIEFLRTLTAEMFYSINDSLRLDFEVGVVVFIGDCSYDGHGILFDGKPYVFLDLSAIIPRLNIYNLNTFITHELIHSIHYFINPDFYRGNFKSIEEKYYKLIFAEGIATKLSSELTNDSDEQIYWFGFLDAMKVKNWINNCEKMKSEIGKEIKNAINTEAFDNALNNKLFSIEDFEKLDMYRVGYYYGAKIVGQFLEHKTIDEVLRLNYAEARKYINDYFSEDVD